MIISVMFQQLYSTVDSIVAGHCRALTHLPLSARHIPSQCFLSLSQTVQISDALLQSRCSAETHYEVEKRLSIPHYLISYFYYLCVLTAVGLSSSKVLLKAMGTPDNIMADSVTYLNILRRNGVSVYILP